MSKLVIAFVAAAVGAVGVAVSGWTAASRTAGADVRVAPDTGAAAPPSTVALSRAARIDGVALRMDVALLRRAGRTATLDLRLRSNAPHGGPTFTVGDRFADYEGGPENLSGVYLMDPMTGRRLRARDYSGECVCTGDGGTIRLQPGGTTMLTATFPAPSLRARSADVVVPHFGAFRDVPLRDAPGSG